MLLCIICDKGLSDPCSTLALARLIFLQLLAETEEGIRALAAFDVVSYSGTALPVRLLHFVVDDTVNGRVFIHDT